MNGEVYRLCRIVAAAKKTLQEDTALSYTPVQYERKNEFHFLPERKLFSTKAYRAESVEAWYAHCLRKGMRDIKLFMPIAAKDRGILGFSNTSQSMIVCFYGNEAAYFTARNEFDPANKVWDAIYTEYEWKNAPSDKPCFADNTESFKTVLSQIRELACMLGCDHFARIFQDAFDGLSGVASTEAVHSATLLELPEKNKHLFMAASTADVFGAMGSWNDGPPYIAREKGLDREYEQLSSELLTQVRIATLHAINEW